MACVGKDDDGETSQRLDWAKPSNQVDIALVRVLIVREVVKDQDDEVPNGKERNNTRVLERVQPFWEAQRDNEEQEKDGYPKLAIREEC